MPVTRRRVLLLSGLAVATLATMMVTGYRYGVSDHAYKIPFFRATQDPSLFPTDPTIGLRHQNFTFMYVAIGPLVWAVGNEWAYFILHALCLFGQLGAMYLLGRLVSGRDGPAWLAVLLLIAPKPFLGGVQTTDAYFLSRTLAYPLLYLCVHQFLAGRFASAAALLGLVANVHPITCVSFGAMLGLTVLADWRRIDKRQLAWGAGAFAVASLPFLIKSLSTPAGNLWRVVDPVWLELILRRSDQHFKASGWYVTYIRWVPLVGMGVYALVRGPRTTYDRRTAMLMASSAVLCVAGWFFTEVVPIHVVILACLFRTSVVVVLLSLVYVARMVVADSQRGSLWAVLGAATCAILVIGETPWLIALGPVTVAAHWAHRRSWAPRQRTLVVVGAMVVGVLLFVRVEAFYRNFGVNWVWRQGQLALLGAMILAGAYALGRHAAHANGSGWPRHAFCPGVGVGVGAYLVLAALLPLVVWTPAFRAPLASRVQWPWSRPVTDLERVGRWARTHTHKAAVFITPPHVSGFRVWAERGIVGTWKDGTYGVVSREFALRWRRTMRDLGMGLGKRHCRYRRFDDRDFAPLGRKYGAHYVLTEADHRLDLPEVYHNNQFRVYRLGEALAATRHDPNRSGIRPALP